jgi:hypothetical protein
MTVSKHVPLTSQNTMSDVLHVSVGCNPFIILIIIIVGKAGHVSRYTDGLPFGTHRNWL